jgi:hypothetical protein
MRTTTLGVLALAMLALTHALRADDPPKLPPELKLLEPMVGTFDEVLTNKPAEWTPMGGRATSVTKKTWSLGGRFLRTDGAWDKTEFISFLTYDPATMEFRTWYFDAGGAFPRGTLHGTWDEKTRTITWSGTDEFGNKTVGKTRIIDQDTHEWTVLTTDKAGKVLLDLVGRNTRRKG